MLVIPQNFSDSLRSRIENGKDTPEWDVTHSVIDVYADKSSKFLSFVYIKSSTKSSV